MSGDLAVATRRPPTSTANTYSARACIRLKTTLPDCLIRVAGLVRPVCDAWSRFRFQLVACLVVLACASGLLAPSASVAIDGSLPSVTLDSLGATAAVSPGMPALETDGVYLPPSLDTSRPVPLLLALHGFAGNGPRIAGRLRECADQYGWLVVAPTMAYRDYFDARQVRADERENLPRVEALLQALEGSATNFTLAPRLLVYGFSRGAQMAHRFSMFYPSHIAAVAALSAGSYTLPEAADRTGKPMLFPFGVADLQESAGARFQKNAFERIPFWIGVGAQDTNPDDTARAWDAFEGQTRVERARAFTAQLQGIGNSVELNVFNGASHEETAAMRRSACAFLAAHSAD